MGISCSKRGETPSICGSSRTRSHLYNIDTSKCSFHEDDEESARESILSPCPADGGECSLYEEEEEEVGGENEEEGEDSRGKITLVWRKNTLHHGKKLSI